VRLETGEESDLPRHDHDYVMIQISGDKVAARFEPDSVVECAGLHYVEGDISPGNVIFAAKGGIETVVNIGDELFHEIVVELKD
jgi:hypothetical protein